MLGRGRQIKLQWMPLARAHPPPALDDHREAGVVYRLPLVRYQALFADHAGPGEAPASGRRTAVSGRMSGEGIQARRLTRRVSTISARVYRMHAAADARRHPRFKVEAELRI